MYVRRAVLGLALAALAAAPASAQNNEFERQVEYQMSIAEAFATSVGFELDDMFFSSLGDGEDERMTFELQTGRDYRMIALCDEDCDDIDIYLEDMDGNVLDEDVSVDDAPVVAAAGRGERVRLRVNMYSCSVEPCYYAVGIFVR